MGGLASVGDESGALVARAERIAARLHPHRTVLVTVGLAGFLVGAFPLVAVVHGWADLAGWHMGVFAAGVPVVLWALCLAVLASLFDPTRGWVTVLARTLGSRRRWPLRLLRGYAALTVAAFALAPLWVLVAAVG